MTNLEGNTRFLATLLLQNYQMYKWTANLIVRIQADIETGVMDKSDELALFHDSIVEAKPQGLMGPLNLETVDWQALLNHCKENLKLSEDDVRLEIKSIELTRAKLRQGFTPKALKDVLPAMVLDEYTQELREKEFGPSFRHHRLDDILALIDWLDRNRGPFDSVELAREIKPMARVRSGEYLARVWQNTLNLRYPEGVPWPRRTKKE